ncbi:hypothetical protein SDC9_89599 [bioreactor metagenome]|uniref:Uncharacterized protein n=1 Tax=bioreactor metagenome TaxID=1076179 RepID=A0A644ZQ98_9ZZZZ
MGPDGLHHRRGAAEVDRNVAVVEVLRVHVGGDVALLPGLRRRVGDGVVPAEVRQLLRQHGQGVELDGLGVGVHPVDEVHRAGAARLRRGPQHGEDRGQSGAAGEQQQGGGALAQEERTVGPVQGQPVPDRGALRQPGGHRPAGGDLHQEAEPPLVGGTAERVGPALVGAGHLDVHVLPGQVAERFTVVDLDGEADHVVAVAVDVHDGGREGAGDRPGHRGGGGDPDHQVRAGLHLARQAEALRRLGLAQGVLDVGAGIVVTRFTEGLAGAAGTVEAVHRDVDPGPVGRLGDRLVLLGRDEAGDTVLEGQGDPVRRDVRWHPDLR